MLKYLSAAFLFLFASLSSFEKLPEKYLVTFGNKEAPIEIIQYYSLSCPHCVSLFRNDFLDIKKNHIDSGKICYTFHPVPMDLTTVQLMCCLGELDAGQKQLLLGVIFEELDLENPEVTTIMLKHSMEIFKKPLEKLDNDDFLKNSDAFASATDFVIQDDKPTTIPSLEIGGKRVNQAPEYTFVSLMLATVFEEDIYEK